jgi:hypothetical protein
MFRKLPWNQRVVLVLWLLAAYLLILYASIRWGHTPPNARMPGSD